MPLKYMQTLGAVAGIPQVVNAVEITCSEPQVLAISAQKREPLSIIVQPTVTPSYGGA